MTYIGSTMSREAIAEACEQAAVLVEQGWQQETWYSPPYLDSQGVRHPATYCTEGALGTALGLKVNTLGPQDAIVLRNCAVAQAVRETIEDEYPEWGFVHLPAWNDADGRTQQQVLDVLHATAKRVLGVEP